MPNPTTNDNPFIEMRPFLKRVVNLMESIHNGKGDQDALQLLLWPEEDLSVVAEEIPELEYSPHKTVLIDQLHVIWNQVVKRQMPAIWVIRTHQPLTTMFSAVCEIAEVNFSKFENWDLSEEDFVNLTRTLGKIAGSPLKICDASRPEGLAKALKMVVSEPVDYVICDWRLEDEELAMVQSVIRDSETLLVCPQRYGN